MNRLVELADARPGLFARFVYFVTRRKLGRVPASVRVLNKSGALLAGMGAFEVGLERSTRVPARTKSLAELRVALQIGCPF